jgi:hypothetical protein
MPVRFSKDLPDDEGRVFLAASPNAAFGILGRRGNDGKLYVGRAMSPPEGKTPEAAIREAVEHYGRDVEFVTGAEADELFRAIAAMPPAYPYFYFSRRRDIEIETGLFFCGTLAIAERKPKKAKREAEKIIIRLCKMRRENPDLEDVVGWWGDGTKPINAVDTDNNKTMSLWVDNECTIVAVRASDKNDGTFPIDSDVKRQFGLITEH